MPQQTKKRWAQLKVGLLAMFALALLAFLIFLMTSSNGLFVTRTDVYTFLDDSAAIATGAPVRLNGITVGRVGVLALSGSNEPNRIVRVTLQIENRYLPSIPVDSQAAIAAENLLGTKYINIKKGRSQATIMAGAEVKSLDTREFDDVVQQGYSTLASLNGIFKKLDTILDQLQEGQGTIGKLLSDDELYKKVVGIVDDTHRVIATLDSQEGTLGKLMHDDSLYTDVRGTLARVNDLADSIQKGDGTIGKLMKDPALYDDTRATIGDLRGILAGLSQGKGTAGKLLSSDDLHNQLQGTIGRLDTLLDKINNGQGTLGQLLVNPSLYQNLDSTTREVNGLMKDFRANPKKFLRIKLGLF
ncbi:MAG: MlaD family protein [Acidobacteriota bacterium]|nr:MlaD family protein [Acidobacteriota bacterium]